MAISAVGSRADTTANRTTSTTITLNFTTAANDWIFVVATNGGANADPSIGGTVVTTGGVSFSKIEGLNGGGTAVLTNTIFAGKATGDHNTQTIVCSGNTDSCSSSCTVLRGVDLTNPVKASGHALCAQGTDQLAALNAGGVSGCWLLLGISCDDNITTAAEAATDPAVITHRAEHISTGGNDCTSDVNAAAMSGTGSTGTMTWTNARAAGIYLIATGLVLQPPQPQALSPTGPTVTITAGTPALALNVAPTGPTAALTAGAATVSQTAPDQAISPVGASVAVTPGTAVVTQPVLDITPAGPSVAITPGTPAFEVNITPTGPTVDITAGTATVSGAGADQDITPDGPTVTITPGTPGLDLSVAPIGPTVNITLGTPYVAMSGGDSRITTGGDLRATSAGDRRVTTVFGPDLAIAPIGPTVNINLGTPYVAMSGGDQRITTTGDSRFTTAGDQRVTTVFSTANITPTGPTVTITPGTATVTQPAAPDQAITPDGPTVAITPGTATVVPDLAIAPTGPTVAITPGTATVTPDQAIAPAAPTVTVTPGTIDIALNVTPSGPTVTITPGTPTVILWDQYVVPTGPTVTITIGGTIVHAIGSELILIAATALAEAGGVSAEALAGATAGHGQAGATRGKGLHGAVKSKGPRGSTKP